MTIQAMHKAAEHLTDTELIEAVREGDLRALEALMRRHNRVLYRTARAILGDDAEAEDAVQEAYLRAYRALGGFRGEAKLSSGSCGSWRMRRSCAAGAAPESPQYFPWTPRRQARNGTP